LKLKLHVKPHTLILGDFIAPLSPIDRSSRQILWREIIKKSEVVNGMDLIDIYRTFYSNPREYMLFSSPHKNFSKIDHIICHNRSINRYKKIEVMHHILSDHHGSKLDFSNNINTRKFTHSWKLNNSQFNDLWVREKIIN
jgi:exonuclease III